MVDCIISKQSNLHRADKPNIWTIVEVKVNLHPLVASSGTALKCEGNKMEKNKNSGCTVYKPATREFRFTLCLPIQLWHQITVESTDHCEESIDGRLVSNNPGSPSPLQGTRPGSWLLRSTTPALGFHSAHLPCFWNCENGMWKGCSSPDVDVVLDVQNCEPPL